MFIIKNMDGTKSWYVYHKDASYSGSNPYSTEMYLDTTDRAYSSGTWNNVAPTSTTFQVSGASSINGDDVDYICYAFAEKVGFSKCGKYTGNGNTDGTFVYTGFKPAFILIKRTDTTKNWFLHDNKRNGYNPQNNYVNPNLSDAENSYTEFDILSNGFKIRSSGTGHNQSGGTYIYYTVAAEPLVGDNPATSR